MRNTRYKRHIFCGIITFVVTAVLLSVICAADEITDEIIEYSGVRSIEGYLPDTLGENGISPSFEDSGIDNVVPKLIKMLFSGFSKELGSFIGLFAFLCVCSVIRLHGELFRSVGKTAEYISLLCLSGYCYVFVSGSVDMVVRAVSETDTFMSVMLPVMTSLYAVSGNAATAIVQNAGVYAAITLFEKINASVLVPLFNFCFAMAIVCRTGSVDLSGVSKFIRNFIIRSCVTLLTFMTAVLFFKSTFSSSADTLAMRGVRYAASFIPIVGALAGEAARTVAASISVIKSSAGILAAVAVIYTVSVPCIALICKKIMLSLCVIAAQIMGVKGEAAFLEEINGILSILLAITVSVGLFFILGITIFIKTAVAI